MEDYKAFTESAFELVFTGKEAIEYMYQRLTGEGEQNTDALEGDVGDILLDFYDMIVVTDDKFKEFLPSDCPNYFEKLSQNVLSACDELAGAIMENEFEDGMDILVDNVLPHYRTWAEELAILRVAGEYDDYQEQIRVRWNRVK